jgi:hypothetical protein
LSIDFIQIRPDTLNNVTNIAAAQTPNGSIDSAIITGSFALLVGLGIFFTLGLKLDPFRFYQLRGAEEGTTRRVTDEIILRLRRIMIIMFIAVGLVVVFGLFPEVGLAILSVKVSVGRIVLAIASGFVVFFIIHLILHPPPTRTNQQQQSE